MLLLDCHFLLYWIFSFFLFPFPFSLLSLSRSLPPAHTLFIERVVHLYAILPHYFAQWMRKNPAYFPILLLFCVKFATAHAIQHYSQRYQIARMYKWMIRWKLCAYVMCMYVYIVQIVHSTYWHNFITNLIRCDCRVFNGVRIRKTNIYDECFLFVLMLLINIHTSILLRLTFHLSCAGCMCEL